MTLPSTVVFETTHAGHKTTIYADAHGLRVQCPAGDLLIVDWYSWLLTTAFADPLHQRPGAFHPFQAIAMGALAGFPPPPGDDDR